MEGTPAKLYTAFSRTHLSLLSGPCCGRSAYARSSNDNLEWLKVLCHLTYKGFDGVSHERISVRSCSQEYRFETFASSVLNDSEIQVVLKARKFKFFTEYAETGRDALYQMDKPVTLKGMFYEPASSTFGKLI